MGCSKEIALNFVIAHSHEARPVIDYFQLSKQTDHSGFNVFEKDRVRLIVSGQGALNAASAAAYLAGISGLKASTRIWVNIGTAGHREHEIGSLWRVNKVTDDYSGKSRYPVALQNSRQPSVYIRGCAVVSVAAPVVEYQGDSLYDMEAAGFFQAASRFATLESIVSFKVVSDNLDQPYWSMDKKQMAGLLEPHIPRIDLNLRDLNSIINIKKNTQPIDKIDIKMTYSQKEMVTGLITSLSIHGLDYQHEIGRSKNAGQLISALSEKLKGVDLRV